MAEKEIAPGLWHWTAPHDRIGVEVSSYYLLPERVVLDPMLPPSGIDWFEAHQPPEDVLLTNRHHDRHAWELQGRFGCMVHCPANGMYEIEGRGRAEPFDFGDELPGGVIAHEVGAICPDESALHIPSHQALAVADGLVHYGDRLGFVPDRLMDDPEGTKHGLRAAYQQLLDLAFDKLLLAHGEPVVDGTKQALSEFVA
jgi:glyoxylase-like metal-dependent hydrolase (beta-lactamase superfamily II)